MALAEAAWRRLRRKTTERGPKLRQAIQIPTQRTVPTTPYLTTRKTHRLAGPIASTARRIAHASTQQTLRALQGSALDPSMRFQHSGGGAISLADARLPCTVQGRFMGRL